MIVLGISETHCATAAILRDGAVVGCASEERFTRLKNDAGYPRLAVDALLRECGLRAGQIDLVVLAGRQAYAREWMNRVLHDAATPASTTACVWTSRGAGSASARKRAPRPTRRPPGNRLPSPVRLLSSSRVAARALFGSSPVTTTPATPRPPTSARRSPGRRPWC
jgi:predicted NodU family carbamoyl transferase